MNYKSSSKFYIDYLDELLGEILNAYEKNEISEAQADFLMRLAVSNSMKESVKVLSTDILGTNKNNSIDMFLINYSKQYMHNV